MSHVWTRSPGEIMVAAIWRTVGGLLALVIPMCVGTGLAGWVDSRLDFELGALPFVAWIVVPLCAFVNGWGLLYLPALIGLAYCTVARDASRPVIAYWMALANFLATLQWTGYAHADRAALVSIAFATIGISAVLMRRQVLRTMAVPGSAPEARVNRTPGQGWSLRPERERDEPAIREVLCRAFRRPDEAALVDALRGGRALRVALVWEERGSILGHVAFSPVRLEPELASIRAVGLGPVAVHPDCQRQGIGAALIREGLRMCRERGYAFVVVLGAPAYYKRFGFVPAARFGLTSPYDAGDAFMVLPLTETPPTSGRVTYRAEFDRV